EGGDRARCRPGATSGRHRYRLARPDLQAARGRPMSSALAGITELVSRETGIETPAARQAALRSAVRRVAPGLDPAAFLHAASDPVGGRALIEKLIDVVTVKETSFLRDPGQLGSIPWRALLHGAQHPGRG